jgi:hypothetical protein
MDVTQDQILTAQVKITKPDGTVLIEEVEMTEEDKRRFLGFHNKEKFRG